MKAIKKPLFALLLIGALYLESCGPMPVRLPELPLAEAQPYFNEVTEVQAIDTAFYQVMDAEGRLLGTLLLSAPFSNHVNGYNGPTPLLIVLDTEGRIQNVVLRDNQETPRFAQKVEQSGLYKAWDGLTVEEALGKQVDAISGATYTSEAVKNSLKVRLEIYQRQLQKDHSASKNLWQRLFTPKRR